VRAFLDTNVLVSAVATRGLCADVLQAVLARHRQVVGKTVLIELPRVLRTKLRLPAHLVDEFDDLLRREAILAPDSPPLDFPVRDEDDRTVLAEAIAGGADVLVTGDRDLLEIEDEPPILILSPRGFWERLAAVDEPQR
jgi:uncharacterized protein